MMSHRSCFGIAPVVVAAMCVGAVGTTVVRRSFDDLCVRAEEVFCGTVSAVESRRDAETGVIHTYTSFEEIEWIHGDATAGRYTLRTLGGTADGERLVVDGMPAFTPGGRYVLFVRGNGRVVCPVVGWRQGCFRITGAAANRGVETYAGRRVISVGDGGPVIESRPAAATARIASITVERFIDAIRRRVVEVTEQPGGDVGP